MRQHHGGCRPLQGLSSLEDRLAPVYDRLGLAPGQLEALTGIRERRWWDRGFRLSEGAIRAGRELRLRIDGEPAGSTVTQELADLSATGFPVTIGANPVYEEQQLDGDVFEVVALGGSLSDLKQRGFERYFAAKFALRLKGP